MTRGPAQGTTEEDTPPPPVCQNPSTGRDLHDGVNPDEDLCRLHEPVVVVAVLGWPFGQTGVLA